MKKKGYIKITLINHTDNDAINNKFICILAPIIQLVLFAILQEEFNFVSITLLCVAALLLAKMSYEIGLQDGDKFVDKGKKMEWDYFLDKDKDHSDYIGISDIISL